MYQIAQIIILLILYQKHVLHFAPMDISQLLHQNIVKALVLVYNLLIM
jgi:hypothetical protein